MSLLLIYVRPFISQLYTISYIEWLGNGTKPREGYIRFIAWLPIKPNSSKMNSSHAWTFQSETISFESLRKLCYAPTSKTSTFIGSCYCLLYIHTCTTKPGRDYVVFFITCLTCMHNNYSYILYTSNHNTLSIFRCTSCFPPKCPKPLLPCLCRPIFCPFHRNGIYRMT